MIQSIPASAVVSVNPSVLSAGGSDLAFNAVFLTKNDLLPNGNVKSFASAEAVGNFFGLSSDEYNAASVYFSGFDGCHTLPDTLYFYPYNTSAEAGYLLGASVKSLTLEKLKTIAGTLIVSIDGTSKTGNINMATVTSFSAAASAIGTALGVAVTYESQIGAFKIMSGTTGASSSVGYATGTAANALGLSSTTGAVVSVGNGGLTPADAMSGVIKAASNWATFTHVWDATQNEKLEFAKWTNSQKDRYMYVAWGKEPAALVDGDTTSTGAILRDNAYDGTACVWGTLDKAAFICAISAATDFSQENGRVTYKFRAQSGLVADITDETAGNILTANGWNYYGAWATANDRFIFLAEGQMAGRWEWIDSYINQIRLNSQIQLGLVEMFVNAKSIPYNPEGIALHRASCQDAISEALNFGTIRGGVSLSNQQTAIINSSVKGVDAATQLQVNGYYLDIQLPSAQVRGNRGSLPMTLWYTDGQSVHKANIESINVQ